MTDRLPARQKPNPQLDHGKLAEALGGIWQHLAAPLRDRLGLGTATLDGLRDDCLRVMASWGEEPLRRAPLQAWLVRLRQELSLEELLLALVQLDRAVRQAGWQLGLPAPEWLAFSEHASQFFEALLAEASLGWQGLAAQNHQLRDELAYFHRLAASLERGPELGEHLTMAVRETARLLHCEFCAILLPQPTSRDVLEIRAAVAPRILTNALEGMSFPLAENGLIAQVFLTGAPASTYQALDDLEITMRRRQTLESLGFTQLMAYPLQTHGRVLGVLCVANRLDDQPWQALEEAWLSTVAGQLAASIRLGQGRDAEPAGELAAARPLLAALGLRDARLEAHGRAVGATARAMGRELGLSEPRLEALEAAGWLHDLGLLALGDALREHTGPLGPFEAARVRRHPRDGARVLGQTPGLEAVAPWVAHHHERWDGTGYPEGLRGASIPLESRILAVADAFHTMIEAQPYQPACSIEAAMAELARGAGTQFDTLAVQALRETRRANPATSGLAPLPSFPASEPQTGPMAPAPGRGDAAADEGAQAPRLLGLLAALVASGDRTDFMARVEAALTAHCALDAFAIYRPLGGRLVPVHAWGFRTVGPGALGDGSLEAYVAACRVPVAVGDPASDPRFTPDAAARAEGLTSLLALPLVAGDWLVGVLTAGKRDEAPFGRAEQTALELTAAMLAQGLVAQGLAERQADMAAHDALTGLASHRAFAERLDAELKRAERYGLPLGAIVLDLDGFSAFNEAHGYGLGDEALVAVAELVRLEAGPADVAARFGADAFALLLPEREVPETMAIAERLRGAIASCVFAGRRAGGARLSAAVGVTSGQAPSARGLLADLRTALERARQEGENRLLFHASVPAGAPVDLPAIASDG